MKYIFKNIPFSHLIVLVIMLLSMYSFAFASDSTTNIVNQAIKQQTSNNNTVNKKELDAVIKTSIEHAQSYQAMIPAIHQKMQPMFAISDNEYAFLFVSFSMPDTLLKQFMKEASQYHIPIIIRGLIHNSMKETMIKAYDLIHSKEDTLNEKNKKMGIQINPRLFKTFSIQAVPALVIAKGSMDCPHNQLCPVPQFDVIYGTLSIKADLEKIADHGNVGVHFAEALLKRGDDASF